MTPFELAESILANGTLKNQRDELIELHSNIDMEELKFLDGIIRKNKYSKSIEVGCAYGLSSLAITGALNGDKKFHTIIDPYQNAEWEGIGLLNLSRAGFHSYKFIEEKSEIALPQLLAEKREFDFAFIDGWHTFDHTLIDFFYLNRLIKVGGTIVIDDCAMPSIRTLVRFIAKFPCYEVSGRVKLEETFLRKFFAKILMPMRFFARTLLPKKVATAIFAADFLVPDQLRNLDGAMIAFKKIKDDERPWNWHEHF